MFGSIRFDPSSGEIAGHGAVVRHLSDLRGAFCDTEAYAQLLAHSDPLLYRVTNIEDHVGEGDLHYGLGILMPGKVGDEYFMTKGHFHAWRPAAELYIGLRGRGMMVLENERTGEVDAVALEANRTVYVPGHTAHRTINIGHEPLVYWGVLSSAAGHDYGSVARRNFRLVVVEADGKPRVMERQEYLKQMEGLQR